MGVGEILDEWTAWRTESVRRRVHFDLQKKKQKLHLLRGLRKILLDIDRAIAIIRGTEEDAEVIPNLMIGFGIDEVQADFIAEIKLRNVNKEYILKRLAETDELEREIERLEDLLGNRTKIQKLIISELEDVIKRHPTKRRTEIVYEHEAEAPDEEDQAEDYPVQIFLSREGYFKKITPQSLRMNSEQKFKEGDGLRLTAESNNRNEVIFLTDRQQAYKARLHEFSDTKASALGDYLPQKLGMDEGESPVFLFQPEDYSGSLVFLFENGKVSKVEASAYETKSNRRRLTGAYSDKSPLVAVFHLRGDAELALYTQSRLLLMNTAMLQAKTTRAAQGVAVMNLKRGQNVRLVLPAEKSRHHGPVPLPHADTACRRRPVPRRRRARKAADAGISGRPLLPPPISRSFGRFFTHAFSVILRPAKDPGAKASIWDPSSSG